MTMEKRNVVENKRTPDHEKDREDEHWDKEAANEFQEPEPRAPAAKPTKPSPKFPRTP